MLDKLAKLIEVKSIVTILLTVCMSLLITGVFTPPESILALYSASYGSVITYFFTRKSNDTKGDN